MIIVQSFLIFSHVSWQLSSLILGFCFFNICLDFTFTNCSNYYQYWMFVLCVNLGGFELYRHFQYWSEFLTLICLAFENIVGILSWKVCCIWAFWLNATILQTYCFNLLNSYKKEFHIICGGFYGSPIEVWWCLSRALFYFPTFYKFGWLLFILGWLYCLLLF